jgi:Tat protein translocase TatB subunit
MFGIGMPEVAVIIVVALLVLGPKRLPEVARALGKGLAEFRRVTGEVNKELQTARDLIESEAREHETQRRAREREQRQAVKAAAVASAVAAGEDVAAAPASPPAADHGAAATSAPEAGPATANDAAPPSPDAPPKG